MGDSCLTKHCIDEHGWGQYECEYENCSYIAYSKEWLLFFVFFMFPYAANDMHMIHACHMQFIKVGICPMVISSESRMGQ